MSFIIRLIVYIEERVPVLRQSPFSLTLTSAIKSRPIKIQLPSHDGTGDTQKLLGGAPGLASRYRIRFCFFVCIPNKPSSETGVVQCAELSTIDIGNSWREVLK